MKNLLFLFMILIGISGKAQEVPSKTNTIIITLPDSNNTHEKLLKVLEDKGYTVKKLNKATSSVITEAKTLKNKSRVSLNAYIKGLEVFLTGTIVVAAQGSMRIENKGAKGTPIYLAFEEMEKVAKAIGSKVRYEIK